MTGVELLRLVSTLRPGLPTLLITGRAELIQSEQNPPGVHRVLGKPYTPEQLSQVVREMVSWLRGLALGTVRRGEQDASARRERLRGEPSCPVRLLAPSCGCGSGLRARLLVARSRRGGGAALAGDQCLDASADRAAVARESAGGYRIDKRGRGESADDGKGLVCVEYGQPRVDGLQRIPSVSEESIGVNRGDDSE